MQQKLKPLIIIGHRNPDTDSVVSALAYASLKKRMGLQVIAGRTGKLNKETKFVLSFLNQPTPPLISDLSGKSVILVDHNDIVQAVPGIEKAEILEIIDHHCLGGLETEKPIFYRAEPVGSTSTIIAKIFNEKAVKISKAEAKMLLTGIISDTLFFNSPTATEEDKKTAKKLKLIAGINMADLAKKMFDAKSSLRGLSASDIVNGDEKEFELNSVKFTISVFETANPDKVKAKSAEIFKVMSQNKTEKKQLIFFLIIDIFRAASFLYILGEEENQIAQKAFLIEPKNRIMYLPGIVSRKKQVVPAISKVIKDL